MVRSVLSWLTRWTMFWAVAMDASAEAAKMRVLKNCILKLDGFLLSEGLLRWENVVLSSWLI